MEISLGVFANDSLMSVVTQAGWEVLLFLQRLHRLLLQLQPGRHLLLDLGLKQLSPPGNTRDSHGRGSKGNPHRK